MQNIALLAPSAQKTIKLDSSSAPSAPSAFSYIHISDTPGKMVR